MFEALLAIPYPAIDPVAIRLGPVAVRWYALAYVAAMTFAWWHVRSVAARQPPGQRIMEKRDVDDLLFWTTLGVVLGGRLGYVLFYKPGYYIEHLDEALSIWRGGMSFHGGLIGVVVAVLAFCRARRLVMLSVADLCCAATPMGLFFGRLTNFINGELWGRKSDVAWAMVFPTGGPDPRHPSQLYQAFLEGLCVFALLWVLRTRFDALKRPGEISGWFFLGYGLARIVGEVFREPDAHLGFIDRFVGLDLGGVVTMGQILSVPMVLLGLWAIRRARRRAAAAARPAPTT
jgi:phosphatidylglycerol:prolipoprotein diacylglycerol transferase